MVPFDTNYLMQLQLEYVQRSLANHTLQLHEALLQFDGVVFKGSALDIHWAVGDIWNRYGNHPVLLHVFPAGLSCKARYTKLPGASNGSASRDMS